MHSRTGGGDDSVRIGLPDERLGVTVARPQQSGRRRRGTRGSAPTQVRVS
jgi:hypothetical protein